MTRLGIIVLVFLTTTSIAQNFRYLEKKGFQEESLSKGNGQFVVSLNKDKTMLAISDIQMEMQQARGRMMASYYAKILNLSSGKLERTYEAASLYYFGNSLILGDASASHGKWEEFSKVTMPPSFELNTVTGERKAIPLPTGFGIMGTQADYALATNFMAGKSLVLEKSGDSFKTVHEFDLTFIKLTEDGKYAYGVKSFIDKNIYIYDLKSGREVSKIRNSEAIQFEYLKKGIVITSSMNKIFVIDADGNAVRDFAAGPYFSVNDAETEIMTVGLDGSIKLFDLNDGKLLAEVKDTQITKAENSSKRVGIPYKISGGKFYLIPYSTGIVSLFDATSKSVAANLFFSEDDWAVIAKDGRIDGTQGALDKLEWVEYNANGRAIGRSTVEASFDKYYTPRLLKLILSDDPGTAMKAETTRVDVGPAPVIDITSVNGNKVPKNSEGISKVSSSQKSATIQVTVSENIAQAKEIRLYHNGKLAGAMPVGASNKYEFNISLNSVFGDNNSVYAVATTVDGMESEKAKLLIVYKKNDNVKPKLYALIVGVNKYANPKYELNYAIPDASAFGDQLAKSNSSILQSVEVVTLFDTNVTKESVKLKFDELKNKIGEQDIFIFYYAGHGTMHDDAGKKEFFIVPHDVVQLYGNEQMLREKALSATELRSLSMNLNAQKQVYIIDACHSASALSSAVATRGAAEEIAIAQLARSTGTFWLTAAGSDQFATELQQLGHGVFTYSLLEALQGKDPASASDGTITIREISSYVERRVPELSTQYKGQPQYPSSFSFGNDFPLVVN